MNQGIDWFQMLTSGGPVGMSILFLLLVLSVVTWIIVVERGLSLGSSMKASEHFRQRFWESKSITDLHSKSQMMDASPMLEVFRSGYNEMVRLMQLKEKKGVRIRNLDTIKRALISCRQYEEGKLQKNMAFLAILASACPFIGLLGTVVGIIRAFHSIGQKGSSSLADVAPGISEALVATALGLAAAIPAVIFYNLFAAKIRKHLLLLDTFSVDLLNILDRHFHIGASED